MSAETFELLNLAAKGSMTLPSPSSCSDEFSLAYFSRRRNSATAPERSHCASRRSRWPARRPDVWRQNWQLLSVYYRGKRAWPSLELPYTVISNPLLQSPLMIVALYLPSILPSMAGALRHRPSIWLVVKRSSSATVIHKCVSNPSVLIYNNYSEINFSNHFSLTSL